MTHPTLRHTMAWLHTWAGVVLGSVLMVIFFMGTLAVFDREIDRWMMPATRLAPSTAPVSVDRVVLPAVEQLIQGMELEQWYAVLPDAREPVVRIRLWDMAGDPHTHFLDPRSGELLPDAGTLGGSSFFYPFHYTLHLTALDIGYWIVGLAAMAMLATLVSGVIIHVRIFKDFFTFRPEKHLRRSVLDLHTLSGVLALPFHFVIALSGLIIFFYFYLPAAIQTVYPENPRAFSEEAQASYTRPAANRPGTLASLDPMLAEARRHWGDGEPVFVRVWHPGDANAYVEVSRSTADRIRADGQSVYFDSATGALLKYTPLMPVASMQRFITGLHITPFAHWPLRWLYFLAGLSGCVMIGTGLVLWVEKRRIRHTQDNRYGARLIVALACTSITGLLIATLVMLIANRLLPRGLPMRESWEAGTFFAAWIGSALHAALRAFRHREARAPWRTQCRLICLLAVAAPVLNWITTGAHPFKMLFDHQWAVVGMDALLLASALLAAWAGRRLARQAPQRHVARPRRMPAAMEPRP